VRRVGEFRGILLGEIRGGEVGVESFIDEVILEESFGVDPVGFFDSLRGLVCEELFFVEEKADEGSESVRGIVEDADFLTEDASETLGVVLWSFVEMADLFNSV